MEMVVKVPVCPLRTGPRPDSPLADQALLGTGVRGLERVGPVWLVETEYRYRGYAPAACLAPRGEGWDALDKAVVWGRNAAPVLAGPQGTAEVLLTAPLGAVLAPREGPEEGWQRVVLPDGREGALRAGWLAPRPRPDPLPEGELGRRLVRAALRYRWAPYLWGGKTPQGVDCSGLTFMAYWLNGISIYRDASPRPGFPLVQVPAEEMAPGDLLFFPGHVALALGGGRYLHASGRAGGVTVNALGPEDPRFRPDLARSLSGVWRYADLACRERGR